MTPEKTAFETDRIRRKLELKNKPMIDNLLKKMNMPNIDLGTSIDNEPLNFDDIKKPKK